MSKNLYEESPALPGMVRLSDAELRRCINLLSVENDIPLDLAKSMTVLAFSLVTSVAEAEARGNRTRAETLWSAYAATFTTLGKLLGIREEKLADCCKQAMASAVGTLLNLARQLEKEGKVP